MNLLIAVVDIDAVDALVERVVAHRVQASTSSEQIDVLQDPTKKEADSLSRRALVSSDDAGYLRVEFGSLPSRATLRMTMALAQRCGKSRSGPP